MTLMSCEIRNRGKLDSDASGSDSFVDEYIARMDTAAATHMELRRALPELQRWQPHPVEVGFYVDKFSAEQHPNSRFWNIEVTYATRTEKSPLDEPWKWSVSSQSLSAYTLVDHQDRMMLNTAGFPFEPFEKKERILIFRGRKNLAKWPNWLLTYPECINSDAVRIQGQSCAPKTLAMAGMNVDEPQEQDDVEFYPLTVELHYRESTWLTVVPSKGFQERLLLLSPLQQQVNGGKKFLTRMILNDSDEPVTEPQFLDAAGQAIRDPKPEDIVLLKFQIPVAKAFSALQLR